MKWQPAKARKNTSSIIVVDVYKNKSNQTHSWLLARDHLGTYKTCTIIILLLPFFRLFLYFFFWFERTLRSVNIGMFVHEFDLFENIKIFVQKANLAWSWKMRGKRNVYCCEFLLISSQSHSFFLLRPNHLKNLFFARKEYKRKQQNCWIGVEENWVHFFVARFS